MKKKILIAVFIIMIIIESLIPIKIEATHTNYEIISIPAKIEHQTAPAEQEYDVKAGIMLEPTVELVTFIVDAVMSAISSIMTQTEFEFVMSAQVKNLDGEVSTTYTEPDMSKYENALGLASLRYPYFTFSPEEIFGGKIALLDINFIDDSNTDEGWLKIRSVVSQWYKVVRMLAIIGLLSVLIYTGIKIILTANTKDKAKYKEFIINWFMAVILVFSLHYIMAFILAAVEQIMELFQGISGIIQVTAGTTTFKTNLIGLVRFRLQETSFTSKVFYLVMYVALITYTIKFTFLYFKRVLKMAFLTIISPIVALTYPIDKMNDGKAQGFNIWFKEFLFNVLLQPMHYILYYILVTTSLTLAATNPLYGVVTLMFLSQSEKLLKKIFGFDKAKAGTVGGLAGAFATGAVTASLMNVARDPLHPLHALIGGGKSKGKGKSGGSSSSRLGQGNYEIPNNTIDDTNPEDFLNVFGSYNDPNRNELEEPESDTQQRQEQIAGQVPEQMAFEEEGPNDRNTILQEIAECKEELKNPDNSPEEIDTLSARIKTLEGKLQRGSTADVFGFDMDMDMNMDMPLGYMDEVPSTQIGENGEPIMTGTQNTTIGENGAPIMAGTPSAGAIDNPTVPQNMPEPNEKQNSSEESKMNKFKNAPVTKGLANVGKTLLKPAWDLEKDPKVNAKRLAGKAIKGVVGAGVGITAAAVQAGISITDGKYSAKEGMLTLAAGYAGVAQIGKGSNGIAQTYKEAANEGEDGKALKEYTEQWYNRDDVIQDFNREFPGKGKEMRRRAANNYVSRGITDFKEQKKAMKFAELLKKERGMQEEEADRVAAATLRYRQNTDKSIIYDKEKRKSFVDAKVEAYTGSASKDAVRKVHEQFLQNIIDFDRANG